MSALRRKVAWSQCLVGVMSLLILAACAQQGPITETPAVDLVWPAPPATPRIRFLYTLSQPGDVDINPGFFRRMAEVFRGSGPNDIRNPYGLALDAEGRMFIVDNHYQAIHVYDPTKNKYFRFPKRSVDDFRNPVGIALGSGGNIFVSDSVAGRVHVFADLGREYAGSIGSGQLQRPTGVAVNHVTGELLVVDTLASQLMVYDEGSLRFKRAVGENNGTADGAPTFHYPTHITVAGDGQVYVTDSLNFRIQVLDPKLKPIGSFGISGDAPGNFSRPKGVATDSDGHVYVIDALFDNVQIFDDEGDLLLAFGGPGNAPGKFWLPNAIFIDPADRIYVSDAYNKRVQVFQYLRQEENPE